MAHRYGQPVQVRPAPGTACAPAAFLWRGVWYQVDETLATWRLRDRWWAVAADVLSGMDDAADVVGGAPGGMAGDARGPTERVYYRVRCVDPEGEQIFDLYHDDARDLWVLDRAHD